MTTKLLKVADIFISKDRRRKEFKEKPISELSEGIKEVGLINAIVVEYVEVVNADGGVRYAAQLVAGERRLKAIGLLNEDYMYGQEVVAKGYVPCLDQGEITALKSRRIELYENLQRLDFTWQERDAAIAAVHELLDATEEEPVTLENLTKVLLKKDEVSYGEKVKVSDALRRQEFINNKLVAGAKSAKDADKIIERQLLDAHKKKLAEQFKQVESPHNIVFTDSVEYCKGYGDGEFDVVVSDPIYGIDMDKQNAFQRIKMQEGKLHGYDDSYINWDRMFSAMPDILFRICKSDAACYLFCDISRFFELVERMEQAGWSVWNRPIIWSKGNIGSLPRPEHGPRYTYECVLFAIKGDKRTTGVYHDVINIPQTTGHSHGAGKPVELYEELLRRCAIPGDRVLDFCAGSFPILEACNRRSLSCDAIELDEKWRDEAELKKLRGLK